jgi:hypothetical protein
MRFPLALANLEAVVLEACENEQHWPAQIAAAIYAGVDFAIAHPEVTDNLLEETDGATDEASRYGSVIGRLAGFLRAKAPVDQRLPGSTDEALVAGMVGLVGDHLRIGRVDRLLELRPDLVLLTLLPYLGFSDAKRWANDVDKSWPGY